MRGIKNGNMDIQKFIKSKIYQHLFHKHSSYIILSVEPDFRGFKSPLNPEVNCPAFTTIQKDRYQIRVQNLFSLFVAEFFCFLILCLDFVKQISLSECAVTAIKCIIILMSSGYLNYYKVNYNLIIHYIFYVLLN